MSLSFGTLRSVVLAAVVLVLAASPAFAQRSERGGFQGGGGGYHSGNVDRNFDMPYSVYHPAYGYYPANPGYMVAPYSYYYTPTISSDRSATIELRVPANAKVWFDDEPTRSTGDRRVYSSPPLDSGKTYHYKIRAQWDDNGKMKEKTQEIEVRAGKQTDMDLTKE